ncbi:MAG: helix-turn-helix domain-containing protein [Lachnospiraceae bacterium]|nr:helix-turn-helix domain-containing protein [Lachnospiraceae bacterium]
MKTTLIPERLISAREKQKLNKTQTAELLGLSPIGYLRYEQGVRAPSAQMLRVIALTLNTSVGFLTGETDLPDPDQILITKEESAGLFELVQMISKDDSQQIARLLEYYSKTINKK